MNAMHMCITLTFIAIARPPPPGLTLLPGNELRLPIQFPFERLFFPNKFYFLYSKSQRLNAYFSVLLYLSV